MTERENALQNVRMHDFALFETALYLDAHPEDPAALAYYQKMRAALAKVQAAYETTYGPLTHAGVNSQTEWTWVNDPWPWEGADN